MTRSHASIGCSAMGAMVPPIPALLQATSRRPKARTASATSASHSAGFATSARKNTARPRAAATSAQVSRPPASFRSETTTAAPSRA